MRTVPFLGCAVAALISIPFLACSSATSPLEESDGVSEDSLQASVDIHLQLPCPSGLNEHWTCDRTSQRRVRCVDGFVQSERCARGCTDPAGSITEAVCNCLQTGLTRWNCSADGNLHACNGGGWMTNSCRGLGCTVAPDGVSDACKTIPRSLQETLNELAPQISQFSPGTDAGISIRDLTTGESAHWRSNVFYSPASTVKALWVAAALHDVGIAKVKPFADPIFIHSDNSASGYVIDLLASPDRVNTFTWHDVGVVDVGFCRWNYDRPRQATNCDRGPREGFNYITSSDAVTFLSALWSKRLLGAEKTKQLLDWMTISPRKGYGGWLGTQLPEAARAKMHHKAGWLPPAEVPGNSNVNEIGIIEVPNGHVYAVTFLLNGAPTQEAYDKLQLPTLEYASCVVYHAVAKDVDDPFAACVHP